MVKDIDRKDTSDRVIGQRHVQRIKHKVYVRPAPDIGRYRSRTQLSKEAGAAPELDFNTRDPQEPIA